MPPMNLHQMHLKITFVQYTGLVDFASGIDFIFKQEPSRFKLQLAISPSSLVGIVNFYPLPMGHVL